MDLVRMLTSEGKKDLWHKKLYLHDREPSDQNCSLSRNFRSTRKCPFGHLSYLLMQLKARIGGFKTLVKFLAGSVLISLMITTGIHKNQKQLILAPNLATNFSYLTSLFSWATELSDTNVADACGDRSCDICTFPEVRGQLESVPPDHLLNS